jgi:hypothetical protein
MTFKNFEHNPALSKNLNELMLTFIDRVDMSARDREIFEDLVMFAFQEGKIEGKTEYLNEQTNITNAETE